MGARLSGGLKTITPQGDACRTAYGNNQLSVDVRRPARLDLLLDLPPAMVEVQALHAWNPDDRSPNVFVRPDDPLTLHRHPVAQSTDAARGRTPYTRGLHAWIIQWPVRQRGTHAVVGVATAEAPLHATGYHSLIGADSHSWGWDLVRNKLFHGGVSAVTLYPDDNGGYTVDDEFIVVLDMDEGTLGFAVRGRFLGVAFSGLRGKKLYPAISCVWGHCEVTMRYIGGLDRKLTWFVSIEFNGACGMLLMQHCRGISTSKCLTYRVIMTNEKQLELLRFLRVMHGVNSANRCCQLEKLQCGQSLANNTNFQVVSS